MRVADLRDELGRRGLSSSGLREALVARLLDASSINNDSLDGITTNSSNNNTARRSTNQRGRKMSAFANANEQNGKEAKKEVASPEAKDEVLSPQQPEITTSTTNQLSPEKTYVLRFDGGSRGNPGIAGAGMVLYDADEGIEIWSGFHYLGDQPYTSNEAEYSAILEGLRCAHALGARTIVIQGDSQLIIRQLEGKYRVKSEKLRPYYQKAVELLRLFDSFHVCHIERAENARADELANEAMDTRQSSMDL